MKPVQSFWSGSRNLLTHPFGWYSPMYHLMGWALSALNLATYYPGTELFTDQNGYEIFIGKLKLPYSKVHVVLDELNKYPVQLWALGKIKTYSLQNEPFIHVDGDVFVYKKFEEDIHKAGLAVQNLEKATDYYSTLFSELRTVLPQVTELVDFDFCDQAACSCNAGIMGGSAIEFYKRLATQIFNFIDNNRPDHLPAHALVNLNILFEQVLFYQLTRKENREITCLLQEIYNDNGYTYEDFADFTSAPVVRGYMHLIGPNKRNQAACELMSRTLLKDYPEYYFRIVSLLGLTESGHTLQEVTNRKTHPEIFKAENISVAADESEERKHLSDAFVNLVKERLKTPYDTADPVSEVTEQQENFILGKAEQYVNEIISVQNAYSQLPAGIVLTMDISSVTDCRLQFLPREYLLPTRLKQQAPLRMINTVFNWTLLKEGSDFSGLRNIREESIVRMICTPGYLFPHYDEVPLEELDFYIFCLLETPNTFEFLLTELKSCFEPADIRNNYDSFVQLILTKVKNLIVNKCLCIVPDNLEDNSHPDVQPL